MARGTGDDDDDDGRERRRELLAAAQRGFLTDGDHADLREVRMLREMILPLNGDEESVT